MAKAKRKLPKPAALTGKAITPAYLAKALKRYAADESYDEVRGLLNERQWRFVVALVEGGTHRSEAAVAAGYSEKNASLSGAQLMRNPKVVAAIQALRDRVEDEAVVSAARVLRELALVAFSDIRNFGVDQDGRLHVLDGVPDELARAVSSIKFKRRVKLSGPKGNKQALGVDQVEIKLWSKIKALDMLGTHLQMFVKEHGPDHPELEKAHQGLSDEAAEFFRKSVLGLKQEGKDSE